MDHWSAGYEVMPALVTGDRMSYPEGEANLVVMDYRLSGRMTAVQAAQETQRRYPQAPIIVLSEHVRFAGGHCSLCAGVRAQGRAREAGRDAGSADGGCGVGTAQQRRIILSAILRPENFLCVGQHLSAGTALPIQVSGLLGTAAEPAFEPGANRDRPRQTRGTCRRPPESGGNPAQRLCWAAVVSETRRRNPGTSTMDLRAGQKKGKAGARSHRWRLGGLLLAVAGLASADLSWQTRTRSDLRETKSKPPISTTLESLCVGRQGLHGVL